MNISGIPAVIFRYFAPALPALTLTALAAGSSIASEREHGAHVHGVGQMNVAVEGDGVEIEITAPGADIVGFEHKPETGADRQALADAVAKLKDGAVLFVFPAKARCKLEEAEVESGLMEDDHEHDKKHRHEKEHGHGHDKEGEHAEFRAHYHFHCGNPDAVTHIDLGYFKAFPAARELEAHTLTARGQGAQELTAGLSRLTF